MVAYTKDDEETNDARDATLVGVSAVEVLVMPPAVSQEMLTAAVKKAVELGVIPRYSGEDQYLANWSNIEAIITAALRAA